MSNSIITPADLKFDEKILREYSTDFGNIFTKKPSAVAHPRSLSSLRECLHYAHSNGMKLTFRGGGQSYYGQSLCDKGMVIDTKALQTADWIPEIGDGWLIAPAGMLLYDLQVFLRQKGLRLPVYTSAIKATLGGTLVAGGISGRSFSRGLLADHVLEIELIGADGKLWKCNSATNSDIFSYSLGTMGMNGAILTAKIKTEPLLPYRVQLVTKNLPIASLLPMCEELRFIPEVVSMEGFINLRSRQITADVYSTIEAENESMINEKAGQWRGITKRLPISSYSIRVVHIDDTLGFSASLAGWKHRVPRNLKMNLMNKKVTLYAAPVPVAFDKLEAIPFIKRFRGFTGHHPLFFRTRPYFAVITSMKQSKFSWLQLSKNNSYVIGFDFFVVFPHFKKTRGTQILKEIAQMAAEDNGRIYPYGFLPEDELLSSLLPNISEQMKKVAEKTDPEHLIKPVLTEIRDMRDSGVRKIRESMPERRFRAYNVGIAKTGTTSIAGIFSKYRAGHEFMFPETTKAISDYKTGVISKEEFRRFLRARDQKENLEMDSASFNFMYLDILIEEYPNAKFIATIRDCYSWLDSFLNMFLGLDIKDWMLDFGLRSFGVTITREMFCSRENLIRALPDILDGIFGYWALGTGFTLDNLPQGRSLVVKTDEISESLDRIAKFMGIPATMLVSEKSHLFIAIRKFNIFHDMDFSLLKEKFEQHCAPLMRKLFPDRTFEAFLENQKKDRMQTYSKSTVGQHPVDIPPRKIMEKTTPESEALLELIKTLNTDYAFERSFKMSEKTLRGDRVLFAVYKNKLKRNPNEKILAVCEQMNVPADLFETFRENLDDADVVGLGSEKIEGKFIKKLYLEFVTKFKEIQNNPNMSNPFLLNFGFKWDALDNTRYALTRYTCHPHLSFEKMQENLSNLFESEKYRKPLEIAKNFLDIISSRTNYNNIVYLDVTEENSQRRSFDINIYKAHLKLKETYPLLSKICRHYSIPTETFHTLYNPIRTKIFGHLSGGIDREGKDFFTIYYGWEKIKGTEIAD